MARHVTATTATAWGADAEVHGGYSCARPGRARAREDLARPLAERLFFAGEATSVPAYGTVHGAYFSGVAAAEAAARTLGATRADTVAGSGSTPGHD